MLKSLAEEIILEIFSFLELKDLISVSGVSRFFSSLTKDPSLWKKVQFSNCKLNRSAFSNIWKNKIPTDQLQSLDLSNCTFLSDEDLEPCILLWQNLRILNLSNTAITGTCLSGLTKSQNLIELDLTNCHQIINFNYIQNFLYKSDNHVKIKLPTADGSNFKSIDSNISTCLVFVNSTKHRVEIYWRNFRGQLQFYMTLLPGEDYIQQTYVSHPWQIHLYNGKCLLYAVGTLLANVVEILETDDPFPICSGKSVKSFYDSNKIMCQIPFTNSRARDVLITIINENGEEAGTELLGFGRTDQFDLEWGTCVVIRDSETKEDLLSLFVFGHWEEQGVLI
eukprot:TRINITY_DN11994_c0_g1_i1.p1 TRINITY_DN11994_c0_g1~~TRINITY_DN11994_c0_g1_i1.p1  ORF type:complete len:337 (-),score=45.53 TRINITY_DN11994_c0_g1_i1:16-1026(-)